MTTIVSATYGPDSKTVGVTFDDGTVLWVPDDPANRHRAELEDWMKVKGNIVQPYVPPPEAKPAP